MLVHSPRSVFNTVKRICSEVDLEKLLRVGTSMNRIYRVSTWKRMIAGPQCRWRLLRCIEIRREGQVLPPRWILLMHIYHLNLRHFYPNEQRTKITGRRPPRRQINEIARCSSFMEPDRSDNRLQECREVELEILCEKK
jgi:hypothetical protein